MHRSPAFRRTARTLFVRDLHLGSRCSQAEDFLFLLESYRPETLYLVGDIVDGWRLRRRWYWRPVFSAILLRLREMAEEGTRICYTPGNHDECLRPFLGNLGLLELADEFIHEAADGRRLLVLHGDKFDDVEQCAPWLSLFGSAAYDSLIRVNSWVNSIRRRLRRENWSFSAAVKFRVKSAVAFISRFEERLREHAGEMGCDGVVCGHIHAPALALREGLLYANSGDWVEHRTALVEDAAGCIKLVELIGDERPVLKVREELSPLAQSAGTPAVS